MSLINALASSPDFRSLTVRRNAIGQVEVEVTIAHPDGQHEITRTMNWAPSEAGAEGMVLMAYGGCCVDQAAEIHRAGHTPPRGA